MPTFDLSYLQSELHQLEHRLKQYGAKSVKNEVSLNKLFVNHLASGGSRTRAIIALAAGRSVGIPESASLAIACSVELLHQASLIHDDIQDQDSLRRGQAAVWSIAGSSSALCLGDELIGGAFEELALIPNPHSAELPRLIAMLSRGISLMAAGQTLDCQWTTDTPTSFEDYEQIVRHKSGPLLGLPIAMTLAITGGTDDQVARVLSGASSIGIAYQLADDFSDKAEDEKKRLNGFWVLAANTYDRSDPEVALRQRFEMHLQNARESVQILPGFCIEAFNILIQALYNKYPSFKAVA